MFALLAALFIILALIGLFGFDTAVLLWLLCIALHYAFGWFSWAPPWQRTHP